MSQVPAGRAAMGLGLLVSVITRLLSLHASQPQAANKQARFTKALDPCSALTPAQPLFDQSVQLEAAIVHARRVRLSNVGVGLHCACEWCT